MKVILGAALLFFYSTAGAMIYGKDDRKDVIDVPQIAELSQAVATSVGDTFVLKKQTPQIDLDFVLASDEYGFGLCKNQKFADQPSGLVNCTGFLVAEDILITAGHCSTFHQEVIKDQAQPMCTDFPWLFDFKKGKDGKVTLKNIPRDNLYYCKKVLYAEHMSGIVGSMNNAPIFPSQGAIGPDFSIIQLDRKVVGRTPLKLSSVSPQKNDAVFTIGHPSALPQKLADNALVIENKYGEYFTTNLDIVGGNSGGPVFNAKNEVIGILVRSFPDADYSYNKAAACSEISTCVNVGEGACAPVYKGEVPGSHVNRIQRVIDFLRTLPKN